MKGWMDMAHVFFIEGLPGSGKTTFSKRLEKILKEEDFTVQHFGEGMHNPLDLAWIAILRRDEYFDVLSRYPHYSEGIRANTVKHGEDYHLAFLWIEDAAFDSKFKREMETHEIYRTKSVETFLEVHRKRFESFARSIDDQTIYVFDCALLQNHLNETMLKYELDEQASFDYFRRLTKPLETLNATILYTKEADVEGTLKRISSERDVAPVGEEIWIDMVAGYVQSQAASKTHDYIGRDGVLRFFTARQERALKVLEALNLDASFFTLENGDYESVFKQLNRVVHQRLEDEANE